MFMVPLLCLTLAYERFSSAMIDIPIEHCIWPRTATPWTGKKTTFNSKADEFTIFVPGKGLYAGG
jgi:hypothetical protein